MLIKTIVAGLAAIVGLASVASADEVPENKIGDRYPWLEVRIQPAPTAFAYAAVGQPLKRFTTEEQAVFTRAKGNF